MESKIFKINKAGLYCIGHYDAVGVRLLLGNPHSRGFVNLDEQDTVKLLKMLDVEWEDGGYLQDLLEGQYVLVGTDSFKFVSIGDPYGRKSIEIKGGETAAHVQC